MQLTKVAGSSGQGRSLLGPGKTVRNIQSSCREPSPHRTALSAFSVFPHFLTPTSWERQGCSHVHTQDPELRPDPWGFGAQSNGEPLPSTVGESGVVVSDPVPQTGSYFQHEVVLPDWGRHRHLPQDPLALQGNGIHGGQEGGHDLWELEAKETRASEAYGRALDCCLATGGRGGVPLPSL